MEILFLSAWYPYPPDNGTKLRVYNLIRGLSQYHPVTLLTLTDKPVVRHPDELIEICKSITAIPAHLYNPKSARALAGFFSPTPRVLVDRFIPAMADQIAMAVHQNHFNAVIASQWYMAAYLNNGLTTPSGKIPAIFEEVEVGVFQDKERQAPSFLKRSRNHLTNFKMASYFRRLLSKFEAITVVSEVERKRLQSWVPGYHQVKVIPNCLNLADYAQIKPVPTSNSLIFTGSFQYSANYEGIIWFLNEVFPKVLKENEDVHLTITGDHANYPLPIEQNISLTGHVADVRPLVTSSWISVAPILTGGGTRLKILEAMAMHTPVVSTVKGAEGLEVIHGEHLLIADSPVAFANYVIALLKDENLRERLSRNAFNLIKQKYSWESVMPEFTQLVEQVADTRHPL